jgi:hypothetical protein
VTIYAVVERSCDDGCHETLWTFSTRAAAEEVAQRRPSAEVRECALDPAVPDLWTAVVGPDGPTISRIASDAQPARAYSWARGCATGQADSEAGAIVAALALIASESAAP